MAVIEAARNLAGLAGAGSTEFGQPRHPVIALMTEWVKGNEVERRNEEVDLGGTMRVGAYDAVLKPGSRVSQIYGSATISERHRHRYEVNIGYKRQLEEHAGLCHPTGPAGGIEIPDHPWFMVSIPSRAEIQALDPHPLFASSSLRRRNRGCGWLTALSAWSPCGAAVVLEIGSRRTWEPFALFPMAQRVYAEAGVQQCPASS
jgi:CTP synthase (UTP-ammonia lyase)